MTKPPSRHSSVTFPDILSLVSGVITTCAQERYPNRIDSGYATSNSMIKINSTITHIFSTFQLRMGQIQRDQVFSI